MTNVQGQFRSCCLIETFSAQVAMPRHPTHLDNPVKAVGVVWAKDVPGSMLRSRISFGLFHGTLLSAPRHKADRARNRPFQGMLPVARAVPPGSPSGGLRMNKITLRRNS
jgi:hypothetical protein